MKYVFMHEHSGEFKVVTMCRVLGVSRRGFYRWQQWGKHPTIRQQQRMILDHLVADAFITRKKRAGSPNLVLDLRDQGHDRDYQPVFLACSRLGFG